MPSARGDREAGDRPCTTMVTLRKTKSLSIILSHLLGTSCHATTLSFNINTLHFSSSYACNHTMTLGGVIWPLPSLLENILSFFFPFTSSIQSCCSASSGVILLLGSHSKQRHKKFKNCPSVVLTAAGRSLVPGRRLRPLEFVIQRGFPLESAYVIELNYLTCVLLITSYITT